jgi:hypothetical protein
VHAPFEAHAPWELQSHLAVVVGLLGAMVVGFFGAVVVGCPGMPPPSGPPGFCFSSACDAMIDPIMIISATRTRTVLCIASSPD